MVAGPEDTAVTIPEEDPIAAFVTSLLLHLPPPGRSLSVVVAPAQIVVVPVIEEGSGLMVSALVAKQPVGNVYVRVVAPFATPLTMPLPEPIVATLVLLLVQVPLPDTSLKVTVDPTHTFADPVIEAGKAFTVITLDVIQPVGKV
jgi:hypothetical protein